MMKAGLCPLLPMETVICDSKLSQLSFSTTSAHSSNAQPSSKRNSLPLEEEKSLRQKNYPGSSHIRFSHQEFEN